jgi:Zn/Cd-binding protein ZinT
VYVVPESSVVQKKQKKAKNRNVDQSNKEVDDIKKQPPHLSGRRGRWQALYPSLQFHTRVRILVPGYEI